MIEAGTFLQNRYRVEKQIGLGGMGAVFVATDERFGSVVAIKETLFSDEKFRKAFEREAKLLNSLKHPALPRVSDHFAEGNGQFLVMEYIEGDDLSEIMEREQKAFFVKDVVNWTIQLLDALEYLHAQTPPVIHRDIKPQNLKLTPQGQIVLLDFGLAKGNPTNSESATAAKSMFGYSRNYASIEQIQGSGTDPRSDLYSLAATAYHLVTGVPPADALTRAMNVLSDKPDPLIPPHEITEEIPANLSGVFYNAMALNGNQRPESAKAMRRMIDESEKNPSNPLTVKVHTPIETNIFTQKTKISPDKPSVKQADIKTDVMSENVSQVTVLKPLKTQSDPQSSRRGLAIGATALATIVLAGSALSAFFLLKTDAPVANSNSAENSIERTTTIVNSTPENLNTEIVNSNTELNNDWTNVNLSNNPTQKRETVRAEVKETPTPKLETKPTQNNPVEETKVEEDTQENQKPTPTPMKTPIFGNRFPRFPVNINPQPIPPDERRRRRKQREQQSQPDPN